MPGPETDKAQQQPKGDDNKAGASDKLRADSDLSKYVDTTRASTANSNELTGLNSFAAGRVVYATGEGLAKSAVHGWNDLTTMSGRELAETAGTGALFGIGMRVLLPEAGAMKALVGTAMSYFMIKDAAMPVLNGWKDAALANDMTEVHDAADTMGKGLGKFWANSAVGLTSGALGEAGAGLAMRNTSIGRRFDAFKDFAFNSEETRAGQFFKWSERTADNTSDKVSQALLGRRSRASADELPLADKLEAIHQVVKHGIDGSGKVADAATPGRRLNLDEILAERKRYRDADYTNKIDKLLQGTEYADVTPPVRAELSGVARMRMLGEQPTGTSPGEHVPNPGTPFKQAGESTPPAGGTTGAGGDAGLGGSAPKSGGTTDGGAGKIIITDAAAAKGGAIPPRPSGDMNSANVGDMAVAMRKVTGSVTKEDIAVAQAKEDIAGPVSSTMRSGKAPLDEGHFSNNELLLGLTDQIKSADDYRSAGMLLDHFRTANIQLEIAARGDKGGLNQITDLNQFSRSVHALMLKALDDLGIPRDVVRGSNSPLFTIRDSDGAGPYTIPAIKDGKTGKPVTDAAVVTYPREYQGLEGVHTSGVYPHELGHDLIYGDLLRFPTEVRDRILTDRVVGDAMKANGIADTEVQVPGSATGTMKKSELFVQLLKAQANENTADMFGTSVDPNTGLSLATLLGSLRKPSNAAPNGPGLLETRSMYSQKMVDADMGNTLGIEPHGIDRWRLKLGAQTLRELAGKDAAAKPVMDYADKLDSLADSMSRPGTQYVWANADQPGTFIAINSKEFDAIIPALVDAQFNTPLEALKGHTLKQLAPNTVERFNRVEALSSQMADAVVKGQTTMPAFDKNGYRIEEVFSAGLSGWMKAVQKNAEAGGNVSAEGLMMRINQLSESLRAQYRNDAPENILTTPPQHQAITARIGNLAYKPVGVIAKWTGQMAEGQPRLRERFADWTPRIGGYAGASRVAPLLFRDLQNTQAVQNQILGDQTNK